MDAGLVDNRTIEQERGGESVVNEHYLGRDAAVAGGEAGDDDCRPLAKLNARQLRELLHQREQQMRQTMSRRQTSGVCTARSSDHYLPHVCGSRNAVQVCSADGYSRSGHRV